jgi:hypothetical protein
MTHPEQLGLAFDARIQSSFEAYHCEHPEVYAKLVELAGELKARGFRRYGIASLFERLRWHFVVDRGADDFKLNNNYRSRYSRKLMEEHPEFSGFFETRELKAQ